MEEEKDESNRSSKTPFFKVTLDQNSTEDYLPVLHLLKARLLFSLGALSRFDVSLMNYFSFSFLIDGAHLSPLMSGIILFTQRLVEAFADPIAGALSDQTRSKYGRRLPWIFIGMIPLTLLWILRWLIIAPFLDHSFLALGYYLLIFSLYSIFRSVQEVPYRALVPDVATSYNQRAQMAFLTSEITRFMSIIGVVIFAVSVRYMENRYYFPALLTALCVGVPRFASVLWIQERSIMDPHSGEQTSHSELEVLDSSPLFGSNHQISNWARLKIYFSAMFEALLFKEFLLLCLIFFILSFGLVLHQSSLLYFMLSDFEKEYSNVVIYGPLGETAAGALAQPLWLWLIYLVGKKNAFFASGILIFILLVVLSFVDLHALGDMILISLVGVSNATLMVIQAILPDTIQAYEMFTHRRDEGFLVSMSLFFSKIGGAAAFGLVSFSFGYAGLSGDTLRTDEQWILKLVCFGIPAVCLLLGSVLMWWMPEYRKKGFSDLFRTSIDSPS